MLFLAHNSHLFLMKIVKHSLVNIQHHLSKVSYFMLCYAVLLLLLCSIVLFYAMLSKQQSHISAQFRFNWSFKARS